MEMLYTFLPIIIMFGAMYLFFIRPEKKRTTKYNEMLSQLTRGDEILTRGGIIGKIASVSEDSIIITTGPDKVKIKVAKNGVAMKMNNEDIAKTK